MLIAYERFGHSDGILYSRLSACGIKSCFDGR